MTALTFSTEHVPSELLEFVRRGAAVNYERTAAFLRLGGFALEDFDPRVSLALGTVTFLHAWDQAGWTFHRRAGLPCWQDALAALVQTMVAAESAPDRLDDLLPLDRAVFRVWVENCAWAGPTELQAEIAVEAQTDDGFLTALADFLWANRHASLRTE